MYIFTRTMENTPVTPPSSPARSIGQKPHVDGVVYKLKHNGVVSNNKYIVKYDTPYASYTICDSVTHEAVGEIQYNKHLQCACTPPFVSVDKVDGIHDGTLSLNTELISTDGLKDCVSGVIEENEQAVRIMQKILSENGRLSGEVTRLEKELKTTQETREKELNLAGFLYTNRKQKQEKEKDAELVSVKEENIRLRNETQLLNTSVYSWYNKYLTSAYHFNLLDGQLTALAKENCRLISENQIQCHNPMKCTPPLQHKVYP